MPNSSFSINIWWKNKEKGCLKSCVLKKIPWKLIMYGSMSFHDFCWRKIFMEHLLPKQGKIPLLGSSSGSTATPCNSEWESAWCLTLKPWVFWDPGFKPILKSQKVLKTHPKYCFTWNHWTQDTHPSSKRFREGTPCENGALRRTAKVVFHPALVKPWAPLLDQNFLFLSLVFLLWFCFKSWASMWQNWRLRGKQWNKLGIDISVKH